MCSDQQHQETISALNALALLLKRRPPEDQTIAISDTKKWKLDYKGFKHIFIWIPGNALTIDFGAYGIGTVQSQVWFNLGMSPGYDICTIGQATDVPIIVRCTDDSIP